jgi:septal ring factor EnvC (AmiA/AmiB activator)
MADESVDLRFIAAQLGKVLDGQRDTNERLGKVEAVISELQAGQRELQIALAATRVDVAAVKADIVTIRADVETIRETQQNQGARLNVIDGRLAILEKHAGLVKA